MTIRLLLLLLLAPTLLPAADSLFLWPDLAPGETSRDPGKALPAIEGENPPITRLVNIRRPGLDLYLPPPGNAKHPAILILPGGGFGRVVPDLEGSEAALWLNDLGIATFVLRYRTNEQTPKDEPLWKRPLQDTQRALRLIRANADQWNIDPIRVGVLAFSAGGQVGAVLHASGPTAAYDPLDDIDQQPCHPDFSLLIYPWRVLDEKTGALLPEIKFGPNTKPAFLVHTHDDQSSSLGSVLLYADLKRHNIPAELHVYANGGHGYGLRPRPDSHIGTWPDRATDWLRLRGLATP